MSLTPQWLDELRARTTLSALIGNSVKVTKAGREYKACCPFHNEKTPSFTINDEKGFYHCFGCGAHGDAIRWMTDQRGLSFMDAVKELADHAGMQVPAADPVAAKKAEQRAGLHDVMAAAQTWFVEQLNTAEGAVARAYLTKRGLTAQTITQFGFGFAPDSRTKLKEALKQFGDAMLIETGMLISVDDKAPYDRFRGRLMIPIRDARGRVIAFGGRILGDGEPKYLNSPDTPLFDKGRTLYNLDKCSPASRATGRVIVVEGYMDAIALSQAGFTDVVAPLGTALTEQQIQMLWRMTETPILCLDGDSAGQKAAMRAASRAMPLLKPGHSLKFAKMPAGVDPDDFLTTNGANALQSILIASEPLVERLWQHEKEALPLSTPEERASLKQRLRTHINEIADPEIKRHYSDAFQERLETLFTRKPYLEFTNRNYGNFKRKIERPLTAEAKSISSSGSDLLMNSILVLLLNHPFLIEEHRERLIDLYPVNEKRSQLLLYLLDVTLSKETLDTDALLTILEPRLYNDAIKTLQNFSLHQYKSRSDQDTSKSMREEISKKLSELIKLAKHRPALFSALETATKRLSLDMTDENFAEQQRLRSEKEAFDRRIFELMQGDLK
jgi:DNA primase